MAEVTGTTVAVKISTDGSSYTDLNRVKSATSESGRVKYDVTAFNDAFQRNVVGKKMANLSVSGYLDLADTGQGTMRTAEAAGTIVYIKILYDSGATAGVVHQGYIASYKEDIKADGVSEFSFELAATAAVTRTS